jgi:flagellar basal body-associated protein FliL
MNKKTLLYVGIYAVVGYGAYYMFFSKSAYAKAIKKANAYSGSEESLKAFGTNYLRPWAKAAKNNVPTFLFEGKAYNTKGGKIVR